MGGFSGIEERWMGSILPFIRQGGCVFDDQVTQILGDAFNGACKELHDKGQPTIVYEVIAKRIIDAARNGEHDAVQLRNIALAAFGFKKRPAGYLAPHLLEFRERFTISALPSKGTLRNRSEGEYAPWKIYR
jgi:hypothetical protein